MPEFLPADPLFESRVRASFTRQQVMKTIGATLTTVEPGAVEIVLPFRADLTQQHAKAQVKRAGRTLTVCTADAYAHGDGEPKVVATMLSTIMAVPERDGLREQQS